MDKTTLGDRMKRYEKVYDFPIINRIPVIVRCDGKGFSRWTKKLKFQKPFDENLSNIMSHTMMEVASNIEGCVFGYTQSDEMTFVLRNDQSNESEPWFGNRIQKISSVVSSMVTANLNRECMRHINVYPPLAYFDSRVFAVPSVMEAINCLIWRQNDATKNSISAACHYEVGKVVGRGTARKLMHGLNQNQQQELLFQKAGINWNDYPTKHKRGVSCYRIVKEIELEDGTKAMRTPWYLDEEIQVFSKLPHAYITTTYLGY